MTAETGANERPRLNDSARFPDPWPSLQPSWPPAPWLMTGRVLTAWFDIPHERLAGLMSAALTPGADDTRRSRLRFYDVDHYADDAPADSQERGHFREATVGFPAAYGATRGELSAHMWSDSDTYMLWGRDVFGWPILRAPLHLDGEIWTGDIRSASTGHATMELEDGSRAAIRVESVGGELPPPAPAAWLTPRLIAAPSPKDERRELLAVRPTLVDPGRRFEVDGDVTLGFREPHPLAGLEPLNPTFELAVGFTLRVGDQVDTL